MHSMLIDPAVNTVFEKMKAQLSDYKEKLDQAQNDLSAWKFTPDRSALVPWPGLASWLQTLPQSNSLSNAIIITHEPNRTCVIEQSSVDVFIRLLVCLCLHACVFRTLVCVCVK